MKYISLLSVVLGIILICYFSKFKLPFLLTIHHFSCTNGSADCRTDLKLKLQKIINHSWPEAKQLTVNILKDDLLVQQYSLRLVLPDTLKISVIDSQPSFAVYSPGQQIYYLIDKSGRVTNLEPENSLPFLTTNLKIPNAGEVVSPKIYFALNLVNRIFYSYKIVNAYVNEDSLSVELSQGITVVFPLEGNSNALLGAFKLIYDKLVLLKTDSLQALDKINYIDLRFKNPIIK